MAETDGGGQVQPRCVHHVSPSFDPTWMMLLSMIAVISLFRRLSKKKGHQEGGEYNSTLTHAVAAAAAAAAEGLILDCMIGVGDGNFVESLWVGRSEQSVAAMGRVGSEEVQCTRYTAIMLLDETIAACDRPPFF